MKISEFTTRYYRDAPAPGIASADRPHDAMLTALQSVDRDIQNQGAVTYETVQLVREALALVGRRS